MNKRWWLKPKWLLGHIIIFLLVLLFLSLAFWQFGRLQDRHDRNDAITSQLNSAPQELKSIQDSDGLSEYKRVKLTGSWDLAHRVLVRYPIIDGVQGYYVLIPFVFPVEGDRPAGAYVVNTGFVPLDKGNEISGGDLGLTEPVEIEGLVRNGEHTSKEQGANTSAMPIPTVGAVDLDQLRPLMAPSELAAKWVQLTSPAQDDAKVLALPELGDGPHKGYMLQWLSFAVIVIVGWIALLSRTGKEQQSASADH